MRTWIWLTLVNVLLVLGGIGGITIGDRPLSTGRLITVTDPAGEKLAATYYPGTKAAGLILLEGFGSDQITMRSAASEFVRDGVHVLTFDFRGHGRSPGALSFDTAATDRLAQQAIASLPA
ncbi:MAG: hypothetical protein JW862_05290 [Anaerolineales bacterium]|nr:hypothetical protein [Anaerolineales bacterium]